MEEDKLLALKARLLIDLGKVVSDRERNNWDACTRIIIVHWRNHEYEICMLDGYICEISKY